MSRFSSRIRMNFVPEFFLITLITKLLSPCLRLDLVFIQLFLSLSYALSEFDVRRNLFASVARLIRDKIGLSYDHETHLFLYTIRSRARGSTVH